MQPSVVQFMSAPQLRSANSRNRHGLPRCSPQLRLGRSQRSRKSYFFPLQTCAAVVDPAHGSQLAKAQSTATTRIPQLSSRFILGDEIGQGSFATVYTCMDKYTGQELAAKALPKHDKGRNTMPAIQREVDCWTALLGCPSVNPLLGVCQDEDAVYLLQPLCRGGDVEMLLVEQGVLSEQQAAAVMAAALGFLAYCKPLGVTYRDIKPANFLLQAPPAIAPTINTSTGVMVGNCHLGTEVLVVDFGCCTKAGSKHSEQGRMEGTVLYMAPEVLRDGPAAAGPATDVWAAGVMMFELLTGRFPFWKLDVDSLGLLPPASIRAGILAAEVAWPAASNCSLSAESRDLIASMLSLDPAQRPSPECALRHPWLLEHHRRPPIQRVVSNAVGLTLHKLKKAATSN